MLFEGLKQVFLSLQNMVGIMPWEQRVIGISETN